MAPSGDIEHRTVSPRLFDWLGHELALFPGPRTDDPSRLMRCEEFVEGDRFVVRAELPGIDPDKDVAVTVADGVLRIEAHRREQHKDRHRSEFFYGELIRTLALPKGIEQDAVTATYRDGILEVSAPLPKPDADPHGRKIDITRQG